MLLILLLVALVPVLLVVAIPFSPFDTSTLYITGNDVIKNYKLDSFDGDDVIGGSVQGLDDKLKFEPSAFWNRPSTRGTAYIRHFAIKVESISARERSWDTSQGSYARSTLMAIAILSRKLDGAMNAWSSPTSN